MYKFFSEKSDYFEDAMRNLADGKIWFSGIDSLNDPWEGMAPLEDHIPHLLEILAKNAGYSVLGISNIKQAPEKTLQIIRNKGIYCVSSILEGRDPRQNKLLWSHYANGGKGVCVEFRPCSIRTLSSSKIGIFHAGHIQYTEEIKSIGHAAIDYLFPSRDDIDKERKLLDLALLQKPKCWDYEDEYRFIADAVGYVPLENCPVSAIYFGPRTGRMVKCLLNDIFSTIDGCFDTLIDGNELKIIDCEIRGQYP